VRVITIEEAVTRSGLSHSQLRHLCRTAQIKARRFGRAWAVDVASLDSYTSIAHPRGRRPKKAVRA
jgi:hypothetical protein